MTGKIYIESYDGKNNLPERYAAWQELGHYRDLSTVWITPTRGSMGTRVAFSWLHVMGGFNQPLCKICVEGYEVGKAYNEAVSLILSNPALSKFKFMLTVEEDNTVPPDGLLKLYESIQKFDVVGGLYWTKGEGGVPMIWGDPANPGTFIPQAPKKDSLQECNGVGMGVTLFRMDIFKNPGFVQGRWFETTGEIGNVKTQDLDFCMKASKMGYKFAVDTRVKCGHYEKETGIIW